jgi:hypothetical protein
LNQLSIISISTVNADLSPNNIIFIHLKKTHPARAEVLGAIALGANAATEEARMAPTARENFIFSN